MTCRNRISIIVAVYNTEEYLRQCLDSIVMQTYSDFQIVLVDDGSTDGSGAICDEYATADERIKVIHQTNGGLVYTRKVGAAAADGEYVYYVDCDDWIDLDLVQGFVDVLEKHDADMVSVGVKREYPGQPARIDKEPVPDGMYKKEDIEKKLIPCMIRTDAFLEWGMYLTYWHYLIRKDILIRNQKLISNEIRMLEDVVCMYPCVLDADRIYVKSDSFYHYRQRANSLKWAKNSGEYNRLKLVYHVLKNRFQNEPDAETLMMKAKYMAIYQFLTSVEGVEFEDAIFPYREFPKGSRVVIYGAGQFGNRMFSALQENGYANVVAWVDKNYESYREQALVVESPKVLETTPYDYILLAVLRADIRAEIKRELQEKNIPQEKIVDMDMGKLNSFSLPADFERMNAGE